MKQTTKAGFSNFELYSIIYFTALFLIGYMIDVYGLFLSQYFHLFGMIAIPTVGILGAFIYMKVANKPKKRAFYIVQ